MLGSLLIICALWAFFSIYRRAVSPLNKIPGPWYSLYTDTWLMLQEFSSKRRTYIHALHQKYGPVLRLGPNEVSFTSLVSKFRSKIPCRGLFHELLSFGSCLETGFRNIVILQLMKQIRNPNIFHIE